jgi:hypothetical protein
MEDQIIKKTFEKIKKGMPGAEKCPDEDDLARYVEDILDEEGTKQIKAHLIGCSKCSEEVASLIVALNRVDSISAEEELPEVSAKQLSRASALVREKDTIRRKSKFSESIVNSLETLSEQTKEFFSFRWIMQPIPIPIKSGVAALLVILFISTAYFYYQQEGAMILNMEVIKHAKITSERGIPKEEIKEKIIKEGDLLNSGDYYQIKFGLNQDAYVYILLHDSTGKLYPAPEVEFPLQYKEDLEMLILPDKERGYILDKNIGTETVFVLASKKPISNVEQTIISLQNLSKEKVLEILKTKVNVVKVLSFKHQ